MCNQPAAKSFSICFTLASKGKKREEKKIKTKIRRTDGNRRHSTNVSTLGKSVQAHVKLV